jgi:lipopolysaccharide export system protein LptA
VTGRAGLAGAAAAIALLAMVCPAHAQPLDLGKGGPIEITSRDGIDLHQNEQVVIARGDARATRGDVTVTADRLIAHYRKKSTGPNAQATQVSAPAAGTPATPDTTDASGNEVFRLEADGNVRIFTATDHAEGDHATYDIDQAVLVLTGQHMKLTTPQDVLTARDSLEYWPQKHIAVGRGNAVVLTDDGRRLSADTMVGYTADPNAPPAPGQPAPPKPATAADPGKPPADPVMASGKLQKVEAFGNVEVRTATETVRGDRGVYVPDTGIARLAGHVRITRGENQMNGAEADVNMKTGIAVLTNPGGRVEGLVVPNDASSQPAANGAPAPPKPAPGKTP